MDLLSTIAIAVGLSMDALAVSVANGVIIKKLKIHQALQIAFSFGLFQFLMPVLGWAAGLSLQSFVKTYDHWIAFALLALIGCKMLWESQSLEEEKPSCLNFSTLIIMSVATSIDALAVGFSFAFLNINIWQPVTLIGLITFMICLAGVYIGNSIGHFFEEKLEILGGVVLILIGLKILVEHLTCGL